MRGKRSKIRHTIAAAQRRGKVLNPKQLASCEGKIRFTKEQAKAKADGIHTMKYYKCQFCTHYHVGRKPWDKRKGNNERNRISRKD